MDEGLKFLRLDEEGDQEFLKNFLTGQAFPPDGPDNPEEVLTQQARAQSIIRNALKNSDTPYAFLQSLKELYEQIPLQTISYIDRWAARNQEPNRSSSPRASA